MDYATYLRDRITELRMKRNVSEYQMSLELGQNKNYIQGISSGKALPSMAQFFNICDYLEISPMQFFDEDSASPRLARQLLEEAAPLSDADLLLLLNIVHRLNP